MEIISFQKEVKATKEHTCNFCGERIAKGETYITSTHKNDGDIYDWKTHKMCDNIADRLKMYENAEDYGVTQDDFQETIYSEYIDLIYSKFSPEDLKKYSDVISQFRCVRFRDKLLYVIAHYNRIDKELTPPTPEGERGR